ncbi:YdcF family protein [Gymnodinialimonas hymeniacidonis]|uniref:YdcF family protein n=1 Tax=Gymnodinialimonas hymeniacidonis TaxID=3126508 RepID=UPI0034C63024
MAVHLALIRPIKMRRVRRVLRLMVIFYAATLAMVLLCNWFWPRDTLPAPAAQVICLGGQSHQGVLASDSTSRAERCAELLLAGLADEILVTGSGTGTLMVDHILALGVPAEAVSLEAMSRSTLQNALFSADISDVEQPVIVVTDAYHLPRSWVSFRAMGFQDVRLSSSSSMVDRPKPLLREVSAIWFNALRLLVYSALFWVDPDIRAALMA